MPGGEQASRLIPLIGEKGVRRLADSSVLVIGTGGVGSSCVEALARGGVGSIAVLDPDVVQLSNINRQALAFHSTIGRSKVDVMEGMIHDIDPDIKVQTFKNFLLAEDVPTFMLRAGHFDWVIDAIDTMTTKVALALYAQQAQINLVSSMGGGSKTDPSLFRFTDIYKTSGCAMCKAMRKACRKAGVSSLRVLYSPEITGYSVSGRRGFGTMSYIPPIMGQMLAGYVIRTLLDSQLDSQGHQSE